jgi:hypothetical protein
MDKRKIVDLVLQISTANKNIWESNAKNLTREFYKENNETRMRCVKELEEILYFKLYLFEERNHYDQRYK